MPRRIEDFTFAHRLRVRFGETDMQGVVYYANYLVYAEVGRFAFLQRLGLDYRLLLGRGLDFTIAEARVRYLSPLRFPEEFDVRVRVGEVRRSSWTLEYLVARADGGACAEVDTTQVLLDRATFRPVRITPEVGRMLRETAS